MANADLTLLHNEKVAKLRAKMMDVARGWLGTPYLWGGNTDEGIDCSHFAYQVLNTARQEVGVDDGLALQKIDYRSTSTIEASGYFVPVAVPERGDFVMWQSHVGVVTDPAAGRFIGAQSAGVAEASYSTGCWAQQPGKRFVRFYWF